jgi:hypothetical protein
MRECTTGVVGGRGGNHGDTEGTEGTEGTEKKTGSSGGSIPNLFCFRWFSCAHYYGHQSGQGMQPDGESHWDEVNQRRADPDPLPWSYPGDGTNNFNTLAGGEAVLFP